MGGHHRHAAETLTALIRALRDRRKIRVVLDDLLAAKLTAADDKERRREGDDSTYDQTESAVLWSHVCPFAWKTHFAWTRSEMRWAIPTAGKGDSRQKFTKPNVVRGQSHQDGASSIDRFQ